MYYLNTQIPVGCCYISSLFVLPTLWMLACRGWRKGDASAREHALNVVRQLKRIYRFWVSAARDLAQKDWNLPRTRVFGKLKMWELPHILCNAYYAEAKKQKIIKKYAWRQYGITVRPSQRHAYGDDTDDVDPEPDEVQDAYSVGDLFIE